MKPGADHKFFFLIAGEKLSDLFSNYGLTASIINHDVYEEVDLNQFEREMIEAGSGGTTASSGHDDFDDCEAEAQTALRESGVPFAVVFKGAKVYGYVSKDKTSTYEGL